MRIERYYDGVLDKKRRLDADIVDLEIDGVTYDARDPMKNVLDMESQYWQEIRRGQDIRLIFYSEHGKEQTYRYNRTRRKWEELKKREG